MIRFTVTHFCFSFMLAVRYSMYTSERWQGVKVSHDLNCICPIHVHNLVTISTVYSFIMPGTRALPGNEVNTCIQEYRMHDMVFTEKQSYGTRCSVIAGTRRTVPIVYVAPLGRAYRYSCGCVYVRKARNHRGSILAISSATFIHKTKPRKPPPESATTRGHYCWLQRRKKGQRQNPLWELHCRNPFTVQKENGRRRRLLFQTSKEWGPQGRS